MQDSKKINNIDITQIVDPSFIKKLDVDQLDDLSISIKRYIIDHVARNGGYLGVNLSIVDLMVAYYKVFDQKDDRLIFDPGDQCYAYKILTGHAQEFKAINRVGGLSNYVNMHDDKRISYCSKKGYGLSQALGHAYGNEITNNKQNICCIINKEDIYNEKCLHALLKIAQSNKKVIIIVNDYDDKDQPSFVNKTINKFRNSKEYSRLKKDVKSKMTKNDISKAIFDGLTNFKDSIREQLVDGGIFDILGIDYCGIINGHDMPELTQNLKKVKEMDKAVVLHIKTKLYHGVEQLEERRSKNEMIEPFNPLNGKKINANVPDNFNNVDFMLNILPSLLKKDRKLVYILVDDDIDTCKNIVLRYHKNIVRCLNEPTVAIGIADGLSLAGAYPIIIMDAWRIKGCIDELISISNHGCQSNISLILTNAQVVKNKDIVYQGIFDAMLLNEICNMPIYHPYDYFQAHDMICDKVVKHESFILRLSSGIYRYNEINDVESVNDRWQYINKISDHKAAIISYGAQIRNFERYIRTNDLKIQLISACIINDNDEIILDELISSEKMIVVVENDLGVLSNHIKEYLKYKEAKNILRIYNISKKDIIDIDDVDIAKKIGISELDVLNEIG